MATMMIAMRMSMSTRELYPPSVVGNPGRRSRRPSPGRGRGTLRSPVGPVRVAGLFAGGAA